MAQYTEVDFDPFAEAGAAVTPTITPESSLEEVDFDPFADGGPAPEAAADPFMDESNFAAEEGDLEWGDLGKSVMAGGANVASGVGWAAEKLGKYGGVDALADAGTAIKETSSDAADWWSGGLSEYAQSANEATFLKPNPESLTGYSLSDDSAARQFDKVKLMVAGSTLGTAAGMGAGAGLTAGLKMIPGVSKGVAAMLGYSSGEALVAAPAAGAQAEDEVRKMSFEDLAGHVEFEALLLTDTPPEEAREILAQSAGGQAAATTAISTAILSSPFGKILDDVMRGEGTTVLSGFLKGAGSEGAQETLQSGAEQLSTNAAVLMQANADKKLMEGVPEAMVGGGLSGAAMGGGMGAAGGYGAEQDADALERQRQIDEESDRVMNAAAEAVRANGGAMDGDPVTPQNVELLANQARADAEAAGGDALAQELAASEVYAANQNQPVTPTPFTALSQDHAAAIERDEANLLAALEGRDSLDPNSITPNLPDDATPMDQPVLTDAQKSLALSEQLEQDEQDQVDANAWRDVAGTEPSRLEALAADRPGPDDESEPGISAREQAEQSEMAELEAEYDKVEATKPKAPKGNAKAPNEEMELLQAIASAGGLSREEAEAQGIDPAELGRQAGGIRRVFTKAGRGFDAIAEDLSQYGFFGAGEEVGPNELMRKLSESLGGNEQYSSNSQHTGAREGANADLARIEQAMFDLEEKQRAQDETDPPEDPAWTGLDGDERSLTYVIDAALDAGVAENTIEHYVNNGILSPSEIESELREAIKYERKIRTAGPPKPAAESGSESTPEAPPETQSGEQLPAAAEEGGTTGDSQPVDMFGAVPVVEQSLADRERELDEKRNGTADVPADISGGLFSNQQAQTDLTDAQPSDEEKAVLQEMEDSTREADERRTRNIAAIGDDATATIFKSKKGDLFYTVTPAANGSNTYQVTVWDKDGAVSDSKHDTAEGIDRHYGGELAEVSNEAEFRELTAGQEADDFALESVEQDNQQPTDLADYTPAAERLPEHNRIAGVLAEKTPVELAKILVRSGIDPTGLSNKAMIQRINMGRDAIEEMKKYESQKQWNDATSSTDDKARLKAWADLANPKAAKQQSPEGTWHNTRLVAAAFALDGKDQYLPEFTEAEQEAKDARDATAMAELDVERTELATLKAEVKQWLTPENGLEVANWWAGASTEDRGLLIDALGFGTDKRKILWLNRLWETEDNKQSVPQVVKTTAQQHLQTFWPEFKADPAAFAEKHTMPSEPPGLSESIENLTKILKAKEAGVLVNELTEETSDGTTDKPSGGTKLEVGGNIPNQSSIGATLDNYEIVPGVQTIQMADIEVTDPKKLFYAADDMRRVRDLASQIKESNRIDPLILVNDADGYYVLEGGHRLGALHDLGETSFPAMVVKDLSGPVADMTKNGGQAAAGGEMGVNGEFYAGGQFMPASARTKKGEYTANISETGGAGRMLVGPGKFATVPKGVSSIFGLVRDFVDYDGDGPLTRSERITDETLDYHQGVSEALDQIDAYNDGKRVIDEAGEFLTLEELEDQENGNEEKAEPVEDSEVRKMGKRLEVLDELLGCLIS